VNKAMSDTVPAVREAEATGETAALFADIREIYRVGVVNLIWRHLATLPGALPWAWGAVRPLYVSGAIGRAADALGLQLPETPALPSAVLEAAGLGAPKRAAITAVLAAYDRTNPMAFVALSALRARLAGERGNAGVEVAQAPVPMVSPEAVELPLPPLLDLGAVAPATAELVLRLNQLGTQRAEPILASMWRTLAHWPTYLALAWPLLAPADVDGRLIAAIAAASERARRTAAGLPTMAVGPLPAASEAPVAAALDRFIEDALARMVVICKMLRRATPD
jgi:hypothetical protein